MGEGLKEYWGLSDPKGSPLSVQAAEFKTEFLNRLSPINDGLSSIKTEVPRASYDALAAKRDKLCTAYSTVSGLIDPQNTAKAEPSIKKFLTAADLVTKEVSEARQQVEAGRSTWEAKKLLFDKINGQVDELEKWNSPDAPKLLQVLGKIQEKVDAKQYANAAADVDKLAAILGPLYAKAQAAAGMASDSKKSVSADAAEKSVAKSTTLSPDLAAEISSIEPALLDRSITPQDLQAWSGGDLDNATDALQRACAALDPNSTLFAGVEQNLSVLETERVRRWESVDDVLHASPSPQKLASMTGDELKESLKTLHDAGNFTDPAQMKNLAVLLKETAVRGGVQEAAKHLAKAKTIDPNKTLTSDILPTLEALLAATRLKELDEKMRAEIKSEAARLGDIVNARKKKAQQLTKLPELLIKPDDPRLKTILQIVEDFPGFNTADLALDLQKAMAGVAVGASAAYTLEVPDGGIDHPPVADWVEFHLAYMGGVFKGIGSGLKDLLGVVKMIAELAWDLAVKALIGPAMETYDLLTDPDGYVAKRKAEVEKASRMAKAVENFVNEFDKNAFDMGSQFGEALGQIIASSEQEFAGKSDKERGEIIGFVVGALVLEVIIEVLLAVGTEGIGNVARIAAGAGQVIGKWKFADKLRRIVRNLPIIKRFMSIIAKGEDVGDGARFMDEVTKLAEEAAKQKPTPKQLPPARPRPTPQMEKKIIRGEPKPTAPREIRGGHSPRIMNDPEFKIESIGRKNADGTRSVRFRKKLADGTWSRPKESTVAPKDWSDAKIVDATSEVASEPPYRTHNGSTFHRKVVDGVEWEVIRDPAGEITSSYPTGGVGANPAVSKPGPSDPPVITPPPEGTTP